MIPQFWTSIVRCRINLNYFQNFELIHERNQLYNDDRSITITLEVWRWTQSWNIVNHVLRRKIYYDGKALQICLIGLQTIYRWNCCFDVIKVLLSIKVFMSTRLFLHLFVNSMFVNFLMKKKMKGHLVVFSVGFFSQESGFLKLVFEGFHPLFIWQASVLEHLAHTVRLLLNHGIKNQNISSIEWG